METKNSDKRAEGKMDVAALPCMDKFVGVMVAEFCERVTDGGDSVAFVSSWVCDVESKRFI